MALTNSYHIKMYKLLTAIFLVMCQLPVCAQDSSLVNKDTQGQPLLFPVGDSAWQEYLKKHIDSTTPVKNKAKPGSYTVVVRFIVTKSNSIADLVAETKHGYGMELEVLKAIKKASPPKWTPEERGSFLARQHNRVSYTFIVPEKKARRKKEVERVGYMPCSIAYNQQPFFQHSYDLLPLAYSNQLRLCKQGIILRPECPEALLNLLTGLAADIYMINQE